MQILESQFLGIKEVDLSKNERAGFKLLEPVICPLLFKNGIDDWPMFLKWSKDYLAETFGNLPCKSVLDSRSGLDGLIEDTTIREYLKHTERASAMIRGELLNGERPIFFSDFKFPNPFFNEADIIRWFFFMTPNGGGALPHAHNLRTFNLLVSGTKEWVLYDADSERNALGFKTLDLFKKEYGTGSRSSDWYANELDDLTRKVGAVYRGIQNEGDVLMIPINYCHVTLNHRPTIAMAVETCD